MTPAISVIMPVYNSGQYLSKAVESILNQSFKDFELILVDDGSTDGSSEICDDYAASDTRVVVIHQKNGGICAARNAALKIAKGEYVAFSDHDDEYLPGLLMDNYRYIKETGTDIVKYGVIREKIINGRSKSKVRVNYSRQVISSGDIMSAFWHYWRLGVFENVWNSIYRKKFLTDNGIMFNTFFKSGGEDFDFNWECLGAGASIATNDGFYYKHYIRYGVSTSAKFSEVGMEKHLNMPEILLSRLGNNRQLVEQDVKGHAFYWVKTVLGTACSTLSYKGCPYEKRRKTDIIKDLSSQDSYRRDFIRVSSLDIMKLGGIKYGLLWWLYKMGLYSFCLKLYELRQDI